MSSDHLILKGSEATSLIETTYFKLCQKIRLAQEEFVEAYRNKEADPSYVTEAWTDFIKAETELEAFTEALEAISNYCDNS